MLDLVVDGLSASLRVVDPLELVAAGVLRDR